MTQRLIEVDIPDEWWTRIERLAKACNYRSSDRFIGSLLDHVQQGVYRSGSWERDWLERLVGPEAVAAAYELEDDPAYVRDHEAANDDDDYE